MTEPTPNKRDWRPWEQTRADKQRALYVGDDDWNDYGALCEAEGVKRNADLRAFIGRRIKALRRKHPDVPLTGDRD